MFCSQCGTELIKEASFCHKCGVRLQASASLHRMSDAVKTGISNDNPTAVTSTVPRPISGQYQFQDSSNLFLFFSCENGSIIEPILSGESPTIYDYIPSFFFLFAVVFRRVIIVHVQVSQNFFRKSRSLPRRELSV